MFIIGIVPARSVYGPRFEVTLVYHLIFSLCMILQIITQVWLNVGVWAIVLFGNRWRSAKMFGDGHASVIHNILFLAITVTGLLSLLMRQSSSKMPFHILVMPIYFSYYMESLRTALTLPHHYHNSLSLLTVDTSVF